MFKGGEKVKNGMCGKTEVHILQDQTNMLYRDIMITKGANPAQLKPVHVIRNEMQRRFFFTLIDTKFD